MGTAGNNDTSLSGHAKNTAVTATLAIKQSVTITTNNRPSGKFMVIATVNDGQGNPRPSVPGEPSGESPADPPTLAPVHDQTVATVRAGRDPPGQRHPAGGHPHLLGGRIA